MAELCFMKFDIWKTIINAMRNAVGTSDALTAPAVAEKIDELGQNLAVMLSGEVEEEMEIVISSNATKIRDYAFYKFLPSYNKDIHIILPDSITEIGRCAFSSCISLTEISLPDGITTIGNEAFSNCQYLNLTSLPKNLTTIGSIAFSSCIQLAITSLPDRVTTIGSNAFSHCTGLTNLTFPASITTIESNSFKDCTNLLTINVPWAEGAVANAPWGATNATINYNYTEEATT